MLVAVLSVLLASDSPKRDLSSIACCDEGDVSSLSEVDSLSSQVIKVTETGVFCLFLGKVWKMKSPSQD